MRWRARSHALRPMTAGRLVVVFGAGGDRDPGKRPLMGEAAADNADVVIVTDDNPRSEEPAAIRAAILAGAPGAIEIGDRGEAIARPIAMLEPGDVLVRRRQGPRDRPDRRRRRRCRSPTTRWSRAALAAEEAA